MFVMVICVIFLRLGDRDLESRKAAVEVFAYVTLLNVFLVFVDFLLLKDLEECLVVGDVVVVML